jgi:hypothetical protein
MRTLATIAVLGALALPVTFAANPQAQTQQEQTQKGKKKEKKEKEKTGKTHDQK